MQGKASEAYDSAAGAAHEATRGPTAYEKVKDRLTPSTADKAKAKANSAYGQAKVSGPAVGSLSWRLGDKGLGLACKGSHAQQPACCVPPDAAVTGCPARMYLCGTGPCAQQLRTVFSLKMSA